MILKSEIRNPKSETSFKYFNFGNFKFVSSFVLIASCLLVLAVPLTVFAQGFVPLAPIEGLTKGVAADTEGLAVFFNNLYKFAIGMATVLAVIMIIWGGIEYSWQDIPGAKSNGKERIQQAILGLVLVLSPVLVFSIINPSILNLSINLKPLDTKSSGTSQTGASQSYNPSTGTGTKEQKVGSGTIVTEGYFIYCTTPDCEKEVKECKDASDPIRNPSYHKIVCQNTDGTVGPNTPDGWFRAKSCPISQNLSVHCIANTKK